VEFLLFHAEKQAGENNGTVSQSHVLHTN